VRPFSFSHALRFTYSLRFCSLASHLSHSFSKMFASLNNSFIFTFLLVLAPQLTYAATTSKVAPTVPLSRIAATTTSSSSSGVTITTSSSAFDPSAPPDVLLKVPNLSVGRIELDVDNLQADINLAAKVASLVRYALLISFAIFANCPQNLCLFHPRSPSMLACSSQSSK
jgi:hypothetical protein